MGKANGRLKKILIVDDDPDFLLLTKRNLKRENPDFDIDKADSPVTALEMVQKKEYDLILSDFDMPEMSGLELLEGIRDKGVASPFIFLTGQGNERIAADALRKGANDYFTKEEQFAQIPRIVNSITHHIHKYHRELERLAIEQELRESEERLRQLVHQMPFPIQVFDADGYAVMMNHEFIDLFGITKPEGIIGVYNVKTDAIIDNLGLKWIVDKAYQGEIGFSPYSIVPTAYLNVEKYGIIKGGSLIFEIMMFPVFRQSGEIWQTVLSFKDITERKKAEDALQESEKKYRFLTESISDVIWIMDTELNLTYMSPSIVHLRGYSLEEAAGHTIEQLLTPDSCALARRTLALELAKEEMGVEDPDRIINIDLELTHKNGTTVWTESNIRLLRDENGKINSLIGITRDITERKKMEQEIKKNSELLIEKNSKLNEFAWTVSHDLKSPLLKIIGYLRMLETSDMVNEEGKEIIESINNISSGMMNFITNTFELSKAGQVTGELELLDLNEIIEGVYITQKPVNLAAELKIPRILPPIKANNTRMTQVFQNLISNAIQHRDAGKDRLIITVEYEENPDSYLFRIKDNGSGIIASSLQKIFRLGYSEKRAGFGSSGFGLSLAKRIIEAHRGKIWAESEGKGKGACFCFTFPR